MEAKVGDKATGIVYDEYMIKHAPDPSDWHPEKPKRLWASWDRLRDKGIVDRCQRVVAREAGEEELMCVHTKEHVDRVHEKAEDAKGGGMAYFDADTYANEYSERAARLAAGGLVELTTKVATGELDNGFALIRPPGHHAEPGQSQGFCLFNNVAVAVQTILDTQPHIKKIMIVDWDVHHGNGTEKTFYETDKVLFLSLHRFEPDFYPNSGPLESVGAGEGKGYNINVPWNFFGAGNAEYLYAFEQLVVPVAKAYQPDLVLVSCGFDAAWGDPLGGMTITASGYQQMTRMLLAATNGKVVLALEGGYNVRIIATCAEACIRALLGEKEFNVEEEQRDLDKRKMQYDAAAAQELMNKAKKVVNAVKEVHADHWPVLRSTAAAQVADDDEPTVEAALAKLSLATNDSETPEAEVN